MSKKETIKINRKSIMPMQFGKEYPGVFIKGDRAMYLSHIMNSAEQVIDENIMANLKMNGWDSLKNSLSSCASWPIDNGNVDCQFLKPFEECIKEGDSEDNG